MKKLTLVSIVALSIVNQTSPMFFRKSKINQNVEKDINVPVFQPEVKISDEKWHAQVSQESLLHQLKGLDGDARKEAIKAWCDEFKKNSKNPAIWDAANMWVLTKNNMIRRMHYEEYKKQELYTLKDKLRHEMYEADDNSRLEHGKNISSPSDWALYDRLVNLQIKQKKEQRLKNKKRCMVITYDTDKVMSLREGLTESGFEKRKFIIFENSPFYKKSQETTSEIVLFGELENNAYDDALQVLYLTKAIIERDLHNQFYFQRLWNYRKRQNSHQALATVNSEIALFEDQDKIVSPEKTVFDRGEEISATDIVKKMISPDDVDKAKDGTSYLKKKQYLKAPLTHREVSARSSMSQTLFEQVKAARE